MCEAPFPYSDAKDKTEELRKERAVPVIYFEIRDMLPTLVSLFASVLLNLAGVS